MLYFVISENDKNNFYLLFNDSRNCIYVMLLIVIAKKYEKFSKFGSVGKLTIFSIIEIKINLFFIFYKSNLIKLF